MPNTPRTAAIFDFDGTLIAGYSILAFLKEHVRKRELGIALLLRTVVSVGQSVAGQLESRELLTRGIHEWNGRKLADLVALGERLFERELRDRIYPEMRALVAEHRRQGHVVAIATSAASFQVAAVARELGIEHVLCTQLEERDGVLTGKSRGPVLWGRAKAEAVRNFARSQRVDLRRAYFYADGDEELSLMRAVGHPRPTNPRPRLAAEAAREGWPVQRFTSRGMPGPDAYLRGALATASAVPVFLGAAAMRALTGEKREAANFLASTLVDLSLGFGKVKLNVTGEEHLWAARPAVFIWNHRSVLDAQIVGRLVQRDFGVVATKELQRAPLVAAASRFIHIAFVDRDDRRAAGAAVTSGTRLLGEGLSMLVAPEAIRVADGGIGEFRKIAFRMAMAAKAPIVPIVIRNVDDIGSRGSAAMRPGVVDVAVLPPISVEGWTSRDLVRRIAGVRQLFVDTLADWPQPMSQGGPSKQLK